MTEYEYRPYRPGDEGRILETHNLVFAEGNPAFVPRTMSEWEWAYTRNPGGVRVLLALDGDLVVAHYAAQPYRVLRGREACSFGQIVDSYVHPAHRSALKRPGLYVKTAERFFERFLSPEWDTGYWGLAIPETWRMGRRFLNYQLVRRQNFLVRDVRPVAAAPAGAREIETFDARAGELFARCSRDWGYAVVRDDRYLNWRFVEHPRHTYVRLAVDGRGGAIAGYAVFRLADWPAPRAGLLVDWLVPPGDLEVGATLREAVLERARREGATSLVAIFPEWSPWCARFGEWGWISRPSDYVLAAQSCYPWLDMHFMRHGWWTQLAEIDLA